MITKTQIGIDKFDYSDVDTSSFYVMVNTYNNDNGSNKQIVRHIRNALAHGNVTIEDDIKFRFVDTYYGHRFEATIEFGKFGEFVQNTYEKFKKEYFNMQHQ